MAVIMDGKKISKHIKERLKKEISLYKEDIGLAVIRIGEDDASRIYVGQKKKVALDIGFSFCDIHLPDDIDEEEVIAKINELNQDSKVHGIVVQLPLPDKFNRKNILNSIKKEKDVDALTDTTEYINCTSLGILELLKQYHVDIEKLDILVVGKSEHVGKQVASLLLKQNKNVVMADTKSDLKKLTLQSDLIIVAVGKKHLITKDMIKDGVVIVDVGINKEDGKIYGDVDYDSVYDKVSLITPVPGGVGPMTVIMLMENTLKAYCKEKQNN